MLKRPTEALLLLLACVKSHPEVSKAVRLRRQFYKRPGGGFLCLSHEGLEDFVGDAIATSTNSQLEGALRRNWWKFAGRKSADAALHEKAGPVLLHLCRKQAAKLAFGDVLLTAAGPNLRVRHVLHTAVPSYPNEQNLGSRQPEQESVEAAEVALAGLAKAYETLLLRAAELSVKSLACPAIGAGFRGYPLEETARVGLSAMLQSDHLIPYIEVRFWACAAFIAWRDECVRLGLASCEEEEVAASLWQGDPLAVWHERRMQAIMQQPASSRLDQSSMTFSLPIIASLWTRLENIVKRYAR